MHKLKYMDGRCVLFHASKSVVTDLKATKLRSKERSVPVILKLDLRDTKR